MQVTTGQNTVKRHLLFRVACLLGAVIALATCLLILSYRSMELRDLREHDKDLHQLLAAALAGPLSAATQPSELSYVISRALFGSADSSARIFCPHLSASPLAAGGAPLADGQLFSPNLSPGPLASEVFDTTPSGLSHASSWPFTHKRLGPCRLEILTLLDSESRRIFSRSYQIAMASAILEGLLMLSLIWIARRGDERLVESEKEQSSMESELFFLAHYDTLTHLPNRSFFWERLDAAIGRAGRLGKAVSLVLVDLRGFGKLNEDEGRAVGDLALVEAARRVQASARSSDLVCRTGSDEFAILLEDLDPELVSETTSLLCASLARQFSEPWSSVGLAPVRCNCGGSVYPQDGSQSEDLLSCALQAAKHAKEADSHILFYERGAGA